MENPRSVTSVIGLCVLGILWTMGAGPSIAQNRTNVMLDPMDDTVVQERVEAGASSVLTELNRAFYLSETPDPSADYITGRGAEDILSQWEEVPFRCPETTVRRSVTPHGTNGYAIRHIPLLQDAGSEAAIEREGVLLLTADGSIDGFVFESEYTPVSPSPAPEVATTAEEPARGTIVIETQPEGATVSAEFEDAAEKQSPAVFEDVAPGEYAFTVRKEKYESIVDTILTVEAGASTTHAVRLTPLFGFLSVEGIPDGSMVRLDGKEQPAPRLDRLEVPVGQRVLSVSKEYFEPLDTTIAVPPGELVAVDVRLRRARVPLRVASAPVGATVRIDRTSIGTTPLETTVEVGRTYELTLEKEGYVPSVPREVFATPDTTLDQKLVMQAFEAQSDDDGVELTHVQLRREGAFVDVGYDLNGAPEEEYAVRLVQVGEGGEEAAIDGALVSGDVGEDLRAGPGKRLRWRDEVPDSVTMRLVVEEQGGNRMLWVLGSVASMGGGAAVAVLTGILGGGSGGDPGGGSGDGGASFPPPPELPGN